MCLFRCPPLPCSRLILLGYRTAEERRAASKRLKQHEDVKGLTDYIGLEPGSNRLMFHSSEVKDSTLLLFEDSTLLLFEALIAAVEDER